MSCSFQNRNFVCDQNRTGLEDRGMEQNDRFSLRVWGVTEVEGIAVWPEATDDDGAGRRVDGMAAVADRNLAIVADADTGLLAPDVGPPRTLRDGADHGAWLGEGLLLGRVRCLA